MSISWPRFHLSVVLILAVAVTTAVAAPQATTPAAPSSSLSLRDDVTLLSVTDKELQDFLLERVAVEEFTECFLGSVSCKSVGAKSLISEYAIIYMKYSCIREINFNTELLIWQRVDIVHSASKILFLKNMNSTIYNTKVVIKLQNTRFFLYQNKSHHWVSVVSVASAVRNNKNAFTWSSSISSSRTCWSTPSTGGEWCRTLQTSSWYK